MCWSVSQHVAVCCSMLQYVAVCCSVLQCVAVCCSVLQCVANIAARFSVLQCAAVCCSTRGEVEGQDGSALVWTACNERQFRRRHHLQILTLCISITHVT